MNRIITSIIVCLVTTAAAAQTKADIEVSYAMTSPNMRTGKLGDSADHYILLANAKESKFYSPRTEQIDSLCSTPEGEAKLNEMQRAAVLGGNLDNPLGQINVKFGSSGMVVSGDIKFADASVVDLIETDYH